MSGITVIYSHHCDSAEIELPVSKSVAARQMMMAAYYDISLAMPDNPCDDLSNLYRALHTGDVVIDVGESGTAYRFMTSYLSQKNGVHLLTGRESLMKRPIHPLVDALKTLGADIDFTDNGLLIKGSKLHGGNVEIDTGDSSQYASSLLLLAPTLREGLTLTLKGPLVSNDYLLMTVKMLRNAGVKCECEERIIRVHQSDKIYINGDYERDWSAASYFLEIQQLTGTKVIMKGLSSELQGDARAQSLFKELPSEVDMHNTPDLVPAYCATLCGLDKPFIVSGIGHLRHKESNRLSTISNELRQLGYLVDCDNDSIRWDGGRCHNTNCVSSHHDHRIVMSMTPLAAKIGCVTIEDADAVNKSFPGYFDQLIKCGFEVK